MFSEAEFARRQPIDYEGIELWVASVEDLIIAKLGAGATFVRVLP